jgi:hypothetical protein
MKWITAGTELVVPLNPEAPVSGRAQLPHGAAPSTSHAVAPMLQGRRQVVRELINHSTKPV